MSDELSGNIGGLINTLWIRNENKPVNSYFIMENKIRVMSFKLKERKQLILAVANLYENYEKRKSSFYI
jgi:hypothetical protein